MSAGGCSLGPGVQCLIRMLRLASSNQTRIPDPYPHSFTLKQMHLTFIKTWNISAWQTFLMHAHSRIYSPPMAYSFHDISALHQKAQLRKSLTLGQGSCYFFENLDIGAGLAFTWFIFGQIILVTSCRHTCWGQAREASGFGGYFCMLSKRLIHHCLEWNIAYEL